MSTAAMARTLTATVPVEPTLQMRLQFPNPPQAKNLGMMNNKLRNRLRLDPSRALEPARKKIATIEAQRVMSVFEDTIQKSEIITLMPFIVENLERFRITFGTELSDLIEHHAVILGSYEDIKQTLDRQMKRNAAKAKARQVESPSRSPTMSPDDPEGNQMLDEDEGPAAGVASPSVQSGDQSRPQSNQQSSRASSRRSDRGSVSRSSRPSSSGSVASNFSMDSQMERTVRSLTMVAQQLNTSCKNVIRAFQLNPSAMNTIKHEYSKRGLASQDFITYMNELKDILLNKLLTTPEEEKERMEYLQEISKRERNNAAIIEKLETELKAAQDDKDEEVCKESLKQELL